MISQSFIKKEMLEQKAKELSESYEKQRAEKLMLQLQERQTVFKKNEDTYR